MAGQRREALERLLNGTTVLLPTHQLSIYGVSKQDAQAMAANIPPGRALPVGMEYPDKQ